MLWRTSLLERKHGGSVTGFWLTYKSFFNSGMRCLRDMSGSEGCVVVEERNFAFKVVGLGCVGRPYGTCGL